ncbi:ATP-binding protein [Actinomadura sp. GTD37]|uniref:ATP-binding protein n=1 Tax=Actinomadura sp. GTD37 TaxID=1778030 RepID=UPI0035C0D479
MVVEVWDEGEGMPVVKGEDFNACNGRGLLLMTQLVRDWGTRPTSEGGKVIWSKFAR